MRSYGLIILFIIAVWRVGGYVDWSGEKFANEFSNERKVGGIVKTDECARLASGGVGGLGRRVYCGFKVWSEGFKKSASHKVQEVLPSPHSELVMGMVLGEDQFKLVPTYNDILKRVGLIHVVVVSGYNISLLFTLLMRVLGSQYKLRNLLIGLFTTLIYAGMSGFGIPAARAWIMGSIAVVFKFYGRPSSGIKVLLFSGLVILCLVPSQLFSISFMLSFLATLGVMVVPQLLEGIMQSLGFARIPVILEDFVTSLSAQLLVNPILSYYFGSMSIVSLISNPSTLWVVPISTILGGLLVVFAFLCPLISKFLAFIIFPFLDYFVTLSEFFADFKSASVDLRLPAHAVVIYYLILFSFARFFAGRKKAVV